MKTIPAAAFRRRFSLSSRFVLVALCLQACAVGPDFLRPVLPAKAGYAPKTLPAKTASTPAPEGAPQAFEPGKPVPGGWWKLFGSDALNRLVDQALAANPDLKAAEAALRQSRETLYANEGAYFPTIDATGNATREKFNPAAFGQAGAPASLFTLYNASVGVSYALDIFGGTRRGLEAYQAEAEASRYQMEAARLTLIGNVVTAAVQEASLRAQVAATQEIAGIQKHQLNVLQKQFELGAISKVAVLAEQAAYAATEATLPPLEKQLAATRNQLLALTGHFPSEKLDAAFDLTALQLPEELPVRLPSQLVEQRPDIRASEEQLHYAGALVGVATANMLPKIELNGSYGFTSVSTANLFSQASSIWSLGAGLTQPIFHGGELLHEKRAAEAAFDEARAKYQSAVLSAFQNVSDALRALQSDAEALAAQATAAKAAADSLNLAQLQYQNGSISYLSLLDAQRTYQQARINLAQAEAARLSDTAALFVALGGGWNNKQQAQPADNIPLVPGLLMDEFTEHKEQEKP